MIGRDAPGWLDHVIGGWQVGATVLMYSGQPLAFTAQNTVNSVVGSVFGVSNTNATTLGSSSSFTPNAVAPLPSNGVQRVSNGIVYFNGLTQVTDPSVANLAGSTLKAIATSSGQLLLVNPLPGQLGSLGYGVVRGPGAKNLNLNLQKTFRINERFNFQLRATALDATNTPIFLNPIMNINDPNFGRINATSTAAQAPGNRIIVLQGRLNF